MSAPGQITCLYAALVALFGAGVCISSPALDDPMSPPEIHTLEDAIDVRSAWAEPQCIVLFDVDWSGTAAVSRYQLEKFHQVWHYSVLAGERPPVPIYRIDIENAEAMEMVSESVADHPVWPMAIGGGGPIVWVGNGHVVDFEVKPWDLSTRNLLDRTSMISDSR